MSYTLTPKRRNREYMKGEMKQLYVVVLLCYIARRKPLYIVVLGDNNNKKTIN